MGELNLIAFNEKHIDKIIEAIELSIDENDFILDEEGEIATCESCECKINRENLGNIMPGSKLFYCDNTACFAQYIHDHIHSE